MAVEPPGTQRMPPSRVDATFTVLRVSPPMTPPMTSPNQRPVARFGSMKKRSRPLATTARPKRAVVEETKAREAVGSDGP